MKPLEGKFVVCVDPTGNLLSVREAMDRFGCRLLHVQTLDELRDVLQSGPIDVLLLRLNRSNTNFLEMFSWSNQSHALPPVVVIADAEDVDLYLDAMRCGAFDCLAYPVDRNELARIAAKAVEASPREMVLPAIA
jgi:DNA-binding NtrC family response regulator